MIKKIQKLGPSKRELFYTKKGEGASCSCLRRPPKGTDKMSAISSNSRILVVDDSILMRQMIRNVLTGLGYANIQEASNGLEALDRLREANEQNDRFEMILLDWAMPEMNGLEFLKTCRAYPETSQTPIIMVTSVSEKTNMIEAMENGVTAYITKPFKPEDMAEMLKKLSVWTE